MNSIGIFVLLMCALAFVSQAQGECCRTSLAVAFTVDGGNCGDVGGHADQEGCTITICANGRPQRGTYCGHGSCNIIGCACKNGCITGNWEDSFKSINSGRNINVIDKRWNL